MVLEKMCAFLSYPVIAVEYKEKLINFISKTDDIITQDSIDSFMEIYNNCLERCVLPKATIYFTINICHQAIEKMNESEINSIKDKTLSRQAIQQLSKMNVKGPMEKAYEIIQILSYLTLFMLFREVSVAGDDGKERSMLEVSGQSISLIQVFLLLMNILRAQDSVQDISENVQKQLFNYTRTVTRLLIKAQKVCTAESLESIATFGFQLGEVLDAVCMDCREDIRKDGQQMARKYLTDLIQIHFNREVMSEIVINILCKKSV